MTADEDKQRLAEALTNDPPRVEDLFLVARVCLAAGDFRGAAVAYKKAAELMHEENVDDTDGRR